MFANHNRQFTMAVTFEVAGDLAREMKAKPITLEHFMQQEEILPLRENNILFVTENKNSCEPPVLNGFVGAAVLAYYKHAHLILRPDDLWTAIVVSLADYVNSKPEELRDIFVRHQGKESIEVVVGSVPFAELEWSEVAQMFTEAADGKLKKKIRQWFCPEFSTTTSKDKLIYSTCLMSALRSYFSFTLRVKCGLPFVTLRGTLEDWKNLRSLIDNFLDFDDKGLKKWHGLLASVLDQFVAAYQGEVDKEFWNSICETKDTCGGSSNLFGWINVFIPFRDEEFVLKVSDKHPWGAIDLGKVPLGLVSAPLKIIDEPGQKVYETTFWTGSLLVCYDEGKNKIKPSSDCILVADSERKIQDSDY